MTATAEAHAGAYLAYPEALEIDLLAYVKREPGSSWSMIEKGLRIDHSEAVSGVAYALAQRFVEDGLLAVDGIAIDGRTLELYRATDEGTERLCELLPSGELPDVEAQELRA